MCNLTLFLLGNKFPTTYLFHTFFYSLVRTSSIPFIDLTLRRLLCVLLEVNDCVSVMYICMYLPKYCVNMYYKNKIVCHPRLRGDVVISLKTIDDLFFCFVVVVVGSMICEILIYCQQVINQSIK